MNSARWKSKTLLFCLLGVSLCTGSSCGAADSGATHGGPALLDLFGELSHLRGSGLEYHVDHEGDLELNRARFAAGQWTPLGSGATAFGFSDAIYWLRFRVENPTAKDTSALVVIDNEYLDRIDLFAFLHSAGAPDLDAQPTDAAAQIHFQKTAGRDFDFYGRDIPRRKYAFPLRLSGGASYELYIAARSRNPMSIPISIMSDARYAEYWSMEQLRMGAYAGFFLLLITASFALFLHFRDNIFLLYMAYLALNFAYQFSLQGYAFQYIWPRAPATAAGFTTLTSCYTVIFALLFARKFLDTPARLPVFDRFILFCMGFAFCVSLALLFVPAHLIDRINGLFLIPASIIASQYAGIRILLQGYRPARFYVLAWGGYSVTLIVLILQIYGMLPNYLLGVEMLEGLALGTTFEMVLFPFAIADRLRLRLVAGPGASAVAIQNTHALEAHARAASSATASAREALPEASEPAVEAKSELDSNARQQRAISRIAHLDLKRVEAGLHQAMEVQAIYREKLTLRDLAGCLSISEKELSEFLNEVLGQSFHDYVNGFRVREACGLLREEPARKVVEIAFAVGFNSLSTFHNAFQKSQGLSPRRYREAVAVETRAARS
ncbi:MAG: helix-turn-helix domain-containing protein [bacterium]|nr:helix-turn-helix domain-containing protein [bacterium]